MADGPPGEVGRFEGHQGLIGSSAQRRTAARRRSGRNFDGKDRWVVLAMAGIPTVLYGAGPRSILEANAHSANEHIKLSDLKAATKIVEASLRDLLRGQR